MVTLYDWTGRPVDLRGLRDEQAAPSVASVRSVLDSQLIDPLTPTRMAAILRDAETPGYGGGAAYLELAERMEERDLHYRGVLRNRKIQVARIGVQVLPASDDAEGLRDAELVEGFFGRATVRREIFDLLDAVGKGFSVSEIDWELSERQWMPKRLIHRLPQWFDFDPDTGLDLRLHTEAGWEPLKPWRFISLQISAKSGLPIRGGLARPVAWAWMFKNYTLKDWVRFVEAYGQPMRLGRFPPGTNPDDRATLMRAVRQVAGDAAAILPEGMQIEFIDDSTVRGRSEIYRDLVAYLDSRISIAVLGQTLTTEQGDRGSQALGTVHEEVRRDIEASDADELAATLGRDLVVPLVTLNHGPRDHYPRIVIERKKLVDLDLLSQALERLVPLGLRVKTDEVLGLLHLSQPGDDDEVLEAGAKEPARARRRAPALARAERPAIAQVLDAIDADEWRSLAGPLIQPVLARASEDPEGMLDDMAALYPAMDVGALAERLARILFVADAWGRLTAGD